MVEEEVQSYEHGSRRRPGYKERRRDLPNSCGELDKDEDSLLEWHSLGTFSALREQGDLFHPESLPDEIWDSLSPRGPPAGGIKS